MKEIIKQIKVILTQEEIDSPLPIKIILIVEDEEENGVNYTITYPKNETN